MHLAHFVLTRFSYRDRRSRTDGAAVKSNHTTVNPLAPQRLARRSQLFETFCLPSILGQTTRDFTWILLIDPELKQKYRDRLRELTGAHPDTHLFEVTSPGELGGLGWLLPYARHSRATHVATTNVDDDDLIGRGLLEYSQRYLRRLGEQATLPPCLIVGCTNAPEWDFLPTRRAPLGHLKPATGRPVPMFSGYTLCCKQPEYDFSALAFEHGKGAAYFDPAIDLKRLTQRRLRAAAERAGDHWREWRPDQHLHVVQSAHPQLVVVNHLENDHITRLFRAWSTRRPVTGPADFPDMSIAFDNVPTVIRRFRRSPAAVMRHMCRGAWLLMTPRLHWAVRRRILWHTLLAPVWFMFGLPEKRLTH